MRTWGVVIVVAIGVVSGAMAMLHRDLQLARTMGRASGPGVTAPPPPVRLAPRGPLRAPAALVQFGVYHVAPQKRSPVALALALAKKAGFAPADELPKEGVTRRLVRVEAHPIAERRPPDLKTFEFRGRRLRPDERERLQQAQAFTEVGFIAPGADAVAAYRAALGVMQQLARQSDGFVEDRAQRQLLSPATLGQQLGAWSAGFPDVRDLVSLEMYREGELMRMVSVGMEKLGLPDLSVSNVSMHDSRSMGNLLNVVLQTMIENPMLARDGELELSLATLHHDGLRKAMLQGNKANATGVATVHLGVAEPQQGDAVNGQFELVFPGPSATLQVRHSELLAHFFGSTDGVTGIDPDDVELSAARQRARRALAKLKPRMTPQPPELSSLLVKAPFKTRTDGTEWMWVEVLRWEGKKLFGVLQNDPYEVDGLQAGSRVEVAEDSLFDYMYRRRDGSTEGGETAKILMAREKH